MAALNNPHSPEASSQLEEIKNRRDALLGGASRISALMQNPNVPENDWLLYFDKVKLLGEKATNVWMLGKYPDP